MRLGAKWAVSSVAVVVLAGCGSTTKTVTAEAPRPATTTVEAPVAPAPTKAQERKTARAAVVELDDLSVGWSTDDDDPPSSSQTSKPTCAGSKKAKAARTARGYAGGFLVDADQSTAYQVVHLFRGPEQAASAFEGMTNRAARKCEARETRAYGEKEWEGSTVTAVRSSQFRVKSMGDRTAATRLTVWYSDAAGPKKAVFETVYSLVGRGLSISEFTDAKEKKRAGFSRAAALKLERTLAKQP